MVLGIPPLEDVDPAGKKRIGHLYKVKAPSRLTGLANNVCVRGKKGCSVYRIKDQLPIRRRSTRSVSCDHCLDPGWGDPSPFAYPKLGCCRNLPSAQ